MSRADSARAVLATLKDHHPQGCASTTLQDLHGPAAKTRIGELRDMGYDIDTDMGPSGAVYTLTSLTPDPTKAKAQRAVQRGCKVIQRPSGEWVVEPYATSLDPEGSQALADSLREFLGPDKVEVIEEEEDEFAFPLEFLR